MLKSKVAVVRIAVESEYAKVREAVRQAIDLSGGLDDLVGPGDLVLVKPNVLAPASPDCGALTSPGALSVAWVKSRLVRCVKPSATGYRRHSRRRQLNARAVPLR